VRTMGPGDPSLRILDSSIGAGRGESLKAGALVFVRILGAAEAPGTAGGPALYRVAIGRLALTAAYSAGLAAGALEPGTLLKARVERAGQAILLKLAEPEALAAQRAVDAIPPAGMPNDQAARAAVTALLREGIGPEAKALARVRRAALRDGDAEGGELAELAAKMEAKGIPATDAALDLLSALADGRGGKGGSGEGRGTPEKWPRPAEGEAKPEAAPEAAFEAAPEAPVASPLALDTAALDGVSLVGDFGEEELPQKLAALLRHIVTRVGEGGTGQESGALPLFNHLRGPEGSWVIAPFRFALGAVDFAGSFRIHLPYVRGGRGRFEGLFTASSGEKTADWSFKLNFGGGLAPALGISGPGGLSELGLAALGKELAGMACSVSAIDSPEGLGIGGASGAGLDFDA
jgi:hypothetical protein